MDNGQWTNDNEEKAVDGRDRMDGMEKAPVKAGKRQEVQVLYVVKE